jgi:hypothetical protein
MSASACPSALPSVIVTLELAGPGLATTSSTSTPVSVGSDGLKVCRMELCRLIHAFFQDVVFAWSGVMNAFGAGEGLTDPTRIVTVKVSRFAKS